MSYFQKLEQGNYNQITHNRLWGSAGGGGQGEAKTLISCAITASTKDGLKRITVHLFRHSAAIWLAEADRPMSEIAQFVGHSDTRTTEKINAKYSPDYSSNHGTGYRGTNQRKPPTSTHMRKQIFDFIEERMVGVTGIEPVTPSMSTFFPPLETAGNRQARTSF